MTTPVTYVELNSPDLESTTSFMRDVFGWEPQPFAAPDYLVAPHGDGPGVDAGPVPMVLPTMDVAPSRDDGATLPFSGACLSRARTPGSRHAGSLCG